jgi:hypothetical protein
MPELPIKENACGLWQTPVADDSINRKQGKWNSRGEPKLSAEVKLWPTPTAWDSERRGSKDTSNLYQTSTGSVRRRNGTNKSSNCGLVDTVKLWPTPKANDPEKRGDFDVNNPRNGLPAAVRKWPTPLARDSRTVKGGARSMNAIGSEPLISQVAETEHVTSGRLNPTWVEWLMGWPMEWTDLKPLETAKFQRWLRWHGEL